MVQMQRIITLNKRIYIWTRNLATKCVL